MFDIGFFPTMNFFVSFFFFDKKGTYYRLTNIVTSYNKTESSRYIPNILKYKRGTIVEGERGHPGAGYKTG